MNTTKLFMIAILIFSTVVIIFSLIKRDRSETSKIDLEDLLICDNGKISKAAAVMLGSFVMTTWLMVYLALGGKMTEGYLAIYVGAWIAPTVTRLIVSPPR
jgi:hypothetical protein